MNTEQIRNLIETLFPFEFEEGEYGEIACSHGKGKYNKAIYFKTAQEAAEKVAQHGKEVKNDHYGIRCCTYKPTKIMLDNGKRVKMEHVYRVQVLAWDLDPKSEGERVALTKKGAQEALDAWGELPEFIRSAVEYAGLTGGGLNIYTRLSRPTKNQKETLQVLRGAQNCIPPMLTKKGDGEEKGSGMIDEGAFSPTGGTRLLGTVNPKYGAESRAIPITKILEGLRAEEIDVKRLARLGAERKPEKRRKSDFDGWRAFDEEAIPRVTASTAISLLKLEKARDAGDRISACCPVHEENKPSFILNKKRWNFKCFSCGEAGSLVQLVQKTAGVEAIEAAKMICDSVGLDGEEIFLDKKKKRRQEQIRLNKERVETVTGQEIEGDEVPDLIEAIADTILRRTPFFFEGGKGFLYWYNGADGLWHGNGMDRILSEVMAIRGLIQPNEKGHKPGARDLFGEVKAAMMGRLGGVPKQIPSPKNNLIPFSNGVFDLDKRELLEYKAEFYFQAKLPVAHDETGDFSKIAGYIKQWFGEEEATAYEVIALCLYRGYPIHKFFVLYGDGGNGKGTFLEIVNSMLGINNISSVPLQHLSGRFQAYSLYNKFANVSDELPPKKIEDTGILKAATGASLVHSDRKNASSVSFYSSATMIFTVNPPLPDTADESDGFYRRIKLIEFKRRFTGNGSEIAELGRTLAADQSALAGLAAHCTKVLMEMKDRGWKMTHEDDIETARHRHMLESNPVKFFVENFCKQVEGDNITKSDFKKNLQRWLVAKNKKGMSFRAIAKAMDAIGIADDMVGGDRVRMWVDIRIDEIALFEEIERLTGKEAESVQGSPAPVVCVDVTAAVIDFMKEAIFSDFDRVKEETGADEKTVRSIMEKTPELVTAGEKGLVWNV